MPGARVEVYRDRFATDLAAINGDAKGTMPMPAAFVIGREQRICVRVSRKASSDRDRSDEHDGALKHLQRR